MLRIASKLRKAIEAVRKASCHAIRLRDVQQPTRKTQLAAPIFRSAILRIATESRRQRLGKVRCPLLSNACRVNGDVFY